MNPRASTKRLSEAWAATRPCPACTSTTLTIVDEPALDLVCSTCQEPYELKAHRGHLPRTLPAGNVSVYTHRFTTSPPNLMVAAYNHPPDTSANTSSGGDDQLDRDTQQAVRSFDVRAVTVFPRTLITPDLIVANKPSTVRRTGRVVHGCRLDLSQLPAIATIPIRVAGCDLDPTAASDTLRRWNDLRTTTPRWHLTVLTAISWLNRRTFTRQELLRFEPWFQAQWPNAKTPAQTVPRVLQELDHAGIIHRITRGVYELTT